MTENINTTQQFIKQLAEREGVSEEKIKEIIIDSFRDSYCQGENAGAELHFEFDSGLSVYRHYKIVEIVNEPKKEITKESKLLKEGQIKENNFFLPLDIKNLSFSLNQEIKNRLRKDVEEISWKRQYNLYKHQQGEIIKGSIKNVQGNNYYAVDLGQGTGHWAKSEWTLREEPRLGQRFYLLIKEVRERGAENAPQIILTRADDLFIHKLLEQEIPQVKSGMVVIRDILRLPGLLSKVLVERGKVAIEKGLRLDPTGTCIGEGGERARSISRLIYSEQIYFTDLPEGSENKEELIYKKKLLSKLLSPVKVKLIVKNEKEWEIIVHQKKAALLLQQEGKMLKKISDYLGVKIHVQIVDEPLKDEGKVLQEIGNYKNINVQIVDEMEK